MADPGLALLLAGTTVFLGFSGGGYFPGATGIVALVLCLALVLRITLVERPFAGAGPALVVPLATLTAFALWTLVSAAWSDAPGRALLEFDRVLLYILALSFFGTLVPSARRLSWALRGFAAGAVVVCASGFVTRVAADLWPIASNVHDDRLSYPVTYWNALGLLTALGLVCATHLTTSEREPRLVRVLGAASGPLLAATLLLTFSRSSLVLVPVGVLAYAAIARPRGLAGGLLAALPPIVVALVFAYRADLLATARFDSSAAIAQGHRLALVVALCMAAAALLRVLLLRLDDRLAQRAVPTVGRSARWGIAAGLVAVVAVGAVAVDLPGRVDRQWHRFVAGDVVDSSGDTRSRLTDTGNNGRLDHWRVALDGFDAHPVLGNGAGTYQLLWARDRPYDFTVNDGHSLYLEVLGELGIVGFLLIAGTLLALLGGLARRARGPDRGLYAAVLALIVVWAIHAGIDWDWEMPAITLWAFALGGLALAGRSDGAGAVASRAAGRPPRMVRVSAALGVLVLALTPAAAAVSQSHLDDAVNAFKRGDCATAINASLDSLDALKVRAEPYEILAFCDIRQGQTQLALQAARNATTRDPDSWETHYGLAIVQAVAGGDPRREAAIALRLNPLEPRARNAVRAFRSGGPQNWKRRALRARLPIQ